MSEAIKAAVELLPKMRIEYAEDCKTVLLIGSQAQAIFSALEALRPVADGKSVVVPVEDAKIAECVKDFHCDVVVCPICGEEQSWWHNSDAAMISGYNPDPADTYRKMHEDASNT